MKTKLTIKLSYYQLEELIDTIESWLKRLETAEMNRGLEEHQLYQREILVELYREACKKEIYKDPGDMLSWKLKRPEIFTILRCYGNMPSVDSSQLRSLFRQLDQLMPGVARKIN